MADKKGSDKDVEIIRNVLSVQHVPVVGTIAWDKLQFLLHSLCDRISSQATRLDKAEEQGKSLASFKDELNLLCQNALTAANADKAAEAEKQAKFWNLIESRLKALESSVSPLQTGQMSVLVALPERMSVLEEATHSLESHVHDMGSQVAQLDSDLQELDADFTAKEARGNGLSTQELTEKIRQLEAQAEEFRQLMQQVTKAQTADLEAIQKTQRMLRADLDAKPLAQSEGGGNEGLAELQKRLERKADVDTVDQLLRASTNTKEGLEALAKAIDEIKKGIRKSSRFSVKMDGPILPAGGDFVSEPTGAAVYEGRCKKLEEELAALANKLSAKADRDAIDEMQFKLASGGGGGGTGGGGGGYDAMKELIAKKADRAEMLELLNSARGKASQVESGLYKELKEKLNTLGSSVTALAERSDLAVLLAKRAEQIAHPVALIQGGAHAEDEEIQFVVNEHANRIMVYADMLLQMQVVLATKADNTALVALRELVEKSKGGGDGGGGGKVAEEMRETIKSHEKMLMKLLEDVGVLGKGVLIMSGHDDDYQPTSIPASPTSVEGGSPPSPEAAAAAAAPASSPPSPASPPPEVASKPAAPPPAPPAPPSPPSAAPAPQKAQAADSAAASAPASPDPSRPATPTRKGSGSPALGGMRKASRLGGASRSGSPQRGSVIRITNVQEATQAVAQSKYRDTLGVLEEALNAKKIEPKENVAVLKKLLIEVEKMSTELENNLALLDNLEQNKAEKTDLQALAKLVKELKAMDNAMLSGKPLLGFKCMSCNHDLEKISPNRGPHIPTGVMPRSFLSMLSAERIFSPDKREGSPPRTPPRTPPYDRTGEFVKIAKKINNSGNHPLRRI